jgi:DNA-binding SARP family transcriptional activator
LLHAERPRTRRSSEPETLVRIRLFGPISVQAGDTVLGPREFGGIKPKQIFEILLLERGHPVPKDRLAEWLWGDALPRNVAATLETYISNIRSAFGPSRIGHRLVVTERDAYRLDGSICEVDLDVFDRLVAGRQSGRAVRSSLESALELARGEVLEDEPWAEWAEPVRERYRRATLRARLDLAELLLALRDFPAAALHAELALAQEALDERAVRLTMLARYAMGRQGEALDAYRQCRAALAKDLGLEPTPETKGLEAAMLRQEALETLLPPRAVEEPDAHANGEPSLDGLGLDLDSELGDLVEVALAGACALAHVGGGEQAVLRLLDEASRLRDALAGNGDRVRALELLRGLIIRGRGGLGGPH